MIGPNSRWQWQSDSPTDDATILRHKCSPSTGELHGATTISQSINYLECLLYKSSTESGKCRQHEAAPSGLSTPLWNMQPRGAKRKRCRVCEGRANLLAHASIQMLADRS